MTPSAPVVFTRAGFLRGARETVPLVIGTAPFGIVCGITAQGAGFSSLESALMSMFVYAGSAQLVALSSWSVPAPVLAATLTAFAVNVRLALMGPVLAPWLDRLRGVRLWGTLFLLADQTWALAVRRMNEGENDAAFLLGSGVMMWIVWLASTMVGHAAGELLRPPPGHPIFFAALAVFVAMLANLWRGRRDLLPWAVAAAVAVVTSRLLPGGSWYIIAGALSGSIAGGVRERMRR